MSHPHSVHHVLNHQHGPAQYIHYTGPPSSSASSSAVHPSSSTSNNSNIDAGTNNPSLSSRPSRTTTTPTTTTPQSVLNNAPQASSSSAMSTITMTTVAPQDTTTTKFVHHYAMPYQYHHYQPPQPPVQDTEATSKAPPAVPVAASSSTSGSAAPTNGQTTMSAAHTAPLVATGDWTRDLVHLAKTAELKKHALTLQLHTAHILSAHAALEQKSKSIQDVKEQRNKLESERTRLLTALRQVNEDRDKAELLEGDLERECSTLRSQIVTLSDGDYATAKTDVDRLRAELGQPPLPSLQNMLDEKAASYLTERRLNGNGSNAPGISSLPSSSTGPSTLPLAPPSLATPTTFRNTFPPSSSSIVNNDNNNNKRPASSSSTDVAMSGVVPALPAKRPRGRPKGSKTQKRV